MSSKTAIAAARGGCRCVVALLVLAAIACRGRDETPPAMAEPSAAPAPAPAGEVAGGGDDAAFFEDVTAELGVDFVHSSGVEGGFFFPEHVGSGGALFDADVDGDLDLYLIAGDEAGTASNRLFRQDGSGRFVDRTAVSGLGDAGYGMGCAVGDVDNDGDPDLYVTNYGADVFYRNRGDGRFEDRTAAAGLGDERWATSACFFDYDRDGALDLYVATYVLHDPPKVCTDQAGRPEYCGPAAFRGEPDLLYRGRGDGTFEAVAGRGPGARPNKGLGVVCADLDGDGWDDVYVANDGEPNNLWINRGDGRFEDRALLLGAATNVLGQPEASMGIGLGDLDGDLDPDLFLSHLDRETNTLYLNAGGDGFEDATAAWDLGRDSLALTGFGTAFFDAENDGDLDLAVVNGRVRRGPPNAAAEVAAGLPAFWRDYAEPNLFLVNDGGGRLRLDARAGGELASRVEVGRGLMVGDLDRDGGLDVAVTVSNGPARIYRNRAPARGHWLSVRVFDPVLGRHALGARAVAETGGVSRLGLVTATYSYLAAVEPAVHFGLGTATEVDRLTVDWPDGARQAVVGLPADVAVTLVRRRGPRS